MPGELSTGCANIGILTSDRSTDAKSDLIRHANSNAHAAIDHNLVGAESVLNSLAAPTEDINVGPVRLSTGLVFVPEYEALMLILLYQLKLYWRHVSLRVITGSEVPLTRPSCAVALLALGASKAGHMSRDSPSPASILS